MDSTRYSSSALEYARSWLLTSAAYPENFDPAYHSDADVVILDLEDGTPPHLKAQARENIIQWVQSTNNPVWVRINPYGTSEWEADLHALSSLSQVIGIMLAKTDTLEHLTETIAACGSHHKFFMPQIESALGLLNIASIAQHPQTFVLAFGINDFCHDTGLGNDAVALAYARSQFAIASAAFKLRGPIDGPCLSLDSSVITQHTLTTQQFGMTGKLCLFKEQCSTVNRTLSPSVNDVLKAQEFLHEFGERGEVIRHASDVFQLARSQKMMKLSQLYNILPPITSNNLPH